MKKLISYGSICLSLFLFQLVYHHFSHGISSASLKYAWLIMVYAGLLWWLIDRLFSNKQLRLSSNLYHSGLACFITWCLLNGVMEIAGSDSPYLWLYLLFGGGFICASLITLSWKEKSKS
ncbi:hypothetical protein [Enterococcus sp.]|uniref:hypothetical protein n=1 Tax=Enterococcus sp. TaxID=35783 RepID=UPI0028B1CA7C|nr:hypothetical protein [Enterococcus sp.]